VSASSVSPEQARKMNVACLAECTIRALGVNCSKPDAATIMEHSIAHACLELEVVEQILDKDQDRGNLAYIVAGIRERLQLAQECSGILATIAGESGAANG